MVETQLERVAAIMQVNLLDTTTKETRSTDRGVTLQRVVTFLQIQLYRCTKKFVTGILNLRRREVELRLPMVIAMEQIAQATHLNTLTNLDREMKTL